MRRELGDGYEVDDDPARVDVDAVHRYLSGESYWASGRSPDVTRALVAGAARVVGLYRDGALVGFSRTVSDGHVHSYLADVFVLPAHRGRGLGVELVRFSVEEGPLAGTRWLLHTRDAHGVYEKVGFGASDGALHDVTRRAAGARPYRGERQGWASRSSRSALAPVRATRSCASESRSRIVTVSSSSVCSSTVNAYGVPISS